MPNYISILRGINVSGHNPIKMEALKRSYQALGFDGVATYIQSGNVVFSAPDTAPERLASLISAQIQQDFGFDVPVIVLTAGMWRAIVEANPFRDDPDKSPDFQHITFLSTVPAADGDRDAVFSKKREGEEVHIAERAVYLYCPLGYGTTKLNNTLLESKLKVAATTRNLKTCMHLLEMCEEIGN